MKYNVTDYSLDRQGIDEIMELKFKLLALAKMTDKASDSGKESSLCKAVVTDKLIKLKDISSEVLGELLWFS